MRIPAYYTLCLVLLALPGLAQNVGIGTVTPHASAMLDVTSTTSGLLAPRMTTAQRTAIASPANGLLVFDTNTRSFWFFDVSAWKEVKSSTYLTDADNDTKIQVEKTLDEDKIRMDLAGSECLLLRRNAGGLLLIEIMNNNLNVFLGQSAGLNNSTAQGNTFLGYACGYANTTGSFNVFIGMSAGSANTTGTSNAFVGVNSGYSNTASYNAFFGAFAGRSNTTGERNTFSGFNAGFQNTTGQNNTFIGAYAGTNNTTGASNTCTGQYSGINNTTATGNTFYGAHSGNMTSTGHSNTYCGYNSGYSNTTGQYNTALGHYAGFDQTDLVHCSFLGYYANATVAGLSNATAIGKQASVSASDQVRIGNAAVSSIGGFVGWTTLPCDGRFKQNVRENVSGLDFIGRLRPVTYTLDLSDVNAFLGRADLDVSAEKEKTVYSGFIAQEVEQAARAAGYDFSGIDAPKNERDLYGLRYAEFVVPLVKAVQEQQAQIEELKKIVAAQQVLLEKMSAAQPALPVQNNPKQP